MTAAGAMIAFAASTRLDGPTRGGDDWDGEAHLAINSSMREKRCGLGIWRRAID